jgi:hypothetical protein
MERGMLVYRHFCGGTIIGEVARVNERSVRIRKLNDAGTCMSDEYVTLKFKREAELKDAHRLEGHPPCWCVTDIHALTPEVAQEKYFRDKLLGCNPYIAKKVGWAERMSASAPPSPIPIEQAMPSQKKIQERVVASEQCMPKDDVHDVVKTLRALDVRTARHTTSGRTFAKPNVTDLINAGKYRDMRADQLEAQLRADLEDSYVRSAPGGTPVKKLDALWTCVWKHAHVDTNGLHDVVYWYGELWPLVAP